eukprot:3485514-Amphidinium_carterae.2
MGDRNHVATKMSNHVGRWFHEGLVFALKLKCRNDASVDGSAAVLQAYLPMLQSTGANHTQMRLKCE